MCCGCHWSHPCSSPWAQDCVTAESSRSVSDQIYCVKQMRFTAFQHQPRLHSVSSAVNNNDVLMFDPPLVYGYWSHPCSSPWPQGCATGEEETATYCLQNYLFSWLLKCFLSILTFRNNINHWFLDECWTHSGCSSWSHYCRRIKD